MFKRRSKCTFVAALLATAYFIYLVVYFTGAIGGSEGAEAVGVGIATALVMPHMTFVLLGLIFNWLGFSLRANWATLTGSILYCVALISFPLYFFFVLPSLILGFVGYAKQRKMNLTVQTVK